jgi:hypothetical protein
VGEEEREFFISLFGDYIFLILCVYAISKKYLKTKRKTLFDLRFFYLSQGEEREDKKRKIKKEQYTHRINSNLPGESIARERKYCFCKQGEIAPLLQKTIPEIEKRKEKHNTQKIIKI